MTDALPPLKIASLLDDPLALRELVERHAPYLPVQRYLANQAQYEALSGGGAMMIAPNFRGDWAYDRPLVEGAEIFLENSKLRDAAATLFSTQWVRPQIVYTNLTWQLPFHQGGGHTDVPAFRGVDRTEYPVWFLQIMGHSRLFEAERINIATAVAWFYEGLDGGFEYWPQGGDRLPEIHQGDTFNTAIVGDNDRMYHRVMPVGDRADGIVAGMTLDSRLEHVAGNDWRIVEDDRELAHFGYERLRISVSWKAQIFRDENEMRRVDDHSDDIDFDVALRRIYDDLTNRGIAFEEPASPLHDEAFVTLLSGVYVREPSVFTQAA